MGSGWRYFQQNEIRQCVFSVVCMYGCVSTCLRLYVYEHMNIFDKHGRENWKQETSTISESGENNSRTKESADHWQQLLLTST